jgi:hypothetical protein
MEHRGPHGADSDFLSRTRITRDDLDFIVASLKTANLVVAIQDNDFAFDSLEELTEKRGLHPTEFEISAEPPPESNRFLDSLSLTFRSGFIHVHCWGQGSLRPTYLELLHYLNGRPKRWSFRGSLTLRRAHDSFLHRNMERVVLLVIGSLVGGVITYVFQTLARVEKGP